MYQNKAFVRRETHSPVWKPQLGLACWSGSFSRHKHALHKWLQPERGGENVITLAAATITTFSLTTLVMCTNVSEWWLVSAPASTCALSYSLKDTHHESRDVCLCAVWGQVHLFGRSTLVLGVHHNTVACEACLAS